MTRQPETAEGGTVPPRRRDERRLAEWQSREGRAQGDRAWRPLGELGTTRVELAGLEDDVLLRRPRYAHELLVLESKTLTRHRARRWA